MAKKEKFGWELSADDVASKESLNRLESMKSLAEEISDFAKENLKFHESLEPIDKQLLNVLIKKKSITKAEYDLHADHLNRLKSQINLSNQIQERVKGMKDEAFGFVDKLEDAYYNLKAIATQPGIATALLIGSMSRDSAKFLSSIEGVRKELGLSGKEASQLTTQIAKASFDLGYGYGEAATSAKAIVESTGNLTDVTKENVREVTRMAEWYGVSADSAATLQRLSHEVQGSTLEIYRNMAKISGVSAGIVMSEVASNTELFAKFSKSGGDNIYQAAIAAKQLGLSLDAVDSIASGLLDVQSSIENEMNASVLLGRRLNLTRARELALSGDLSGMMKEILNNVVSVNEWEGMNLFQRQALAQAIGINVSQLQTMIAQQQDLNKQTELQGKWWGGIWMGVRNVLKTAGEYKETLIASGNFLFAMGHNLKFLNTIAGGLLSKFKGISGITGKLFGATAATPGTAGIEKGTGVLSRSFTGLSKNMGNILKGAAAMALMAGALFIFGKALQELAKVEDIWKMLGVAGAALLGFTLILAAVGAIMMSGVGAVAILAGAGAFVIMSGALFILGKALQQIAPPMESFSTHIAQLAEHASDMPMIGSGFAAMGLGIMSLVGSLIALTPLIPVLGALTALNAVNAEINARGGTTVEHETKRDPVLEELKAIRKLIEQGSEIKLGQDKVGRWFGKQQSTANALEN